MELSELLDLDDLEAAVGSGLVRRQTHPLDPGLRIHNYTEQAVHTRTWTPVTRQCRGLVTDGDGTVVARPWAKFFNHGENGAEFDLAAPVEVTDKADGSLGILYPAPDGPAVATRGSFAGEQAAHATARLRAKYDGWTAPAGWTFLTEIIYPANRIVLDYGDLDDLVLLGAVEIATGRAVGPGDDVTASWPGPRIDVHRYVTLADALAAEPRSNAEGLVVRYLGSGEMLKLKQADYVALHRIITGLTARRLWERAAVFAVLSEQPDTTAKRLGQVLRMDPADVAGVIDAGPDWAEEIRRTAPEEFTGWIDATLAALVADATAVLAAVHTEVDRRKGTERREIAAGIAGHPHRGMVFAGLDGKPLVASAWAAVRPEAEKPFADRTEDEA